MSMELLKRVTKNVFRRITIGGRIFGGYRNNKQYVSCVRVVALIKTILSQTFLLFNINFT